MGHLYQGTVTIVFKHESKNHDSVEIDHWIKVKSMIILKQITEMSHQTVRCIVAYCRKKKKIYCSKLKMKSGGI